MRSVFFQFEQELPELESEYRQQYLKSDINQVITGICIWIIPYVGFIFVDYMLFGMEATFFWLIAVRVLYIIVSVFVIYWLLYGLKQHEQFDRLVLFWGLISLLSLAVIGHSRQQINEANFLLELVAVFSFYIFIPNKFYIRVAPPMLFSLYVILTAAFSPLIDSILMISAVIFTFIITNLIGILFSVRHFSLRRQEFHSRKEEAGVSAELQRLASTDSLTGVFNRRRLIELAGDAFYRFKRYGRPFSILLMDLDGFKRVNDTYGHLEGDRTLIQFAAMIAAEKREVDILGRMGGDEFCLVLPETLPADAAMLSDRILVRCSQIAINGGGLDVRVSVSIGITQALPSDNNLDAIFARADAALYQAKESGRSRRNIL
jgi:diguanylate cyclase (GGDEF)-like protein